jgi:2,4-dienoyl-CoA reductase-like NADH-dependent reductase (Old Yellow Enzyme family)
MGHAHNRFELCHSMQPHIWTFSYLGNVQVDPKHLTLGRDMIIPPKITAETVKPFAQLASAMRSNGMGSSQEYPPPLAIMQLSHAGRQSPSIVGGRPPWKRPLAPSAVALHPRDGILSKMFYSLLFPRPREMSDQEVVGTIQAFIRGAKLSYDAGFDGVQIHCSHGCE